jgi:hypothetical protein
MIDDFTANVMLLFALTLVATGAVEAVGRWRAARACK